MCLFPFHFIIQILLLHLLGLALCDRNSGKGLQGYLMVFDGVHILHIHKIIAVRLDKAPIVQKIAADSGKRLRTFDDIAGEQVIEDVSADARRPAQFTFSYFLSIISLNNLL